MSFNDMKVSELKEVCDYFGVDQGKNKTETLNNLQELGVDWDQWVKFQKMEEDARKDLEDSDDVCDSQEDILVDHDLKEPIGKFPAAEKFVKKESNVLLKLVSKNFSFQILGYNFSQRHPFVVMSSQDAQKIIDFHPDSFRMATPREVEEFYG